MDMRPVGMGCHDEGMASLRESHRRFIANVVGLLRRDLTGLEGLPDLVGDDISLGPASGDAKIFLLGQQELLVHRFLITGVGRNQLAVFRLLAVLCIVGSVLQALGDRPALVLMHGNESGRRHRASPPFLILAACSAFPEPSAFPSRDPSAVPAAPGCPPHRQSRIH